MGLPYARVAVIGAGSWGTAVASLLAHNAPTVLWARRPELADELRTSRMNSRYLPGQRVHDELVVTSDLADAVTDAALVVVAVPSAGFRDVVRSFALHLEPQAVLMSVTKGLERGTGQRMSEVLVDLAPDHAASVLSGPNLAFEIRLVNLQQVWWPVMINELPVGCKRFFRDRCFGCTPTMT